MILVGKDGPNTLGVVAAKSGRTKIWSELFDSAVFPGTQGGPLMHVVAAKAVAYQEALKPDFKQYQTQVQANAKALANRFLELGYTIVSGGTDNHLILIDLRNKNVTGKVAEEALGLAAITVNKNMVPFDTESPFVTSGIRIGTPAMTTRGFKESEFIEIANLIDQVIQHPESESNHKTVTGRVKEMCDQYPLY
jgi:glycine hydroxymethyltransferase